MRDLWKFNPLRVFKILLRSPTLQVTMLSGIAGIGFSVANLLLAWFLPTRDYGLIVLAVSLINLGYPLAPLGLEGIVVRRKLSATPHLLYVSLLTGIATGIVIALIGALVYQLEFLVLALVCAAIVGGGAAYLASSKFRSLERFPLSVVLAQASNYFLLLAALVTIGVDSKSAGLALWIVALGHALMGIWGWRKLFQERGSRTGTNQRLYWVEALSLAGVNGAVLLLLQLERLTIPKLLNLDELASFSVLAAIVIAPFRMLQMGVATTLVPRLRNTVNARARLRLLLQEAVIVSGVVVVTCVTLWYATPLLVQWLFDGKYLITTSLLLAALITGLLKVLSGFSDGIITALGSTRELMSWNALGWFFVVIAGIGAIVGARWGLPGVIYGVALGWLGRVAAAVWISISRLRNLSVGTNSSTGA